MTSTRRVGDFRPSEFSSPRFSKGTVHNGVVEKIIWNVPDGVPGGYIIGARVNIGAPGSAMMRGQAAENLRLGIRVKVKIESVYTGGPHNEQRFELELLEGLGEETPISPAATHLISCAGISFVIKPAGMLQSSGGQPDGSVKILDDAIPEALSHHPKMEDSGVKIDLTGRSYRLLVPVGFGDAIDALAAGEPTEFVVMEEIDSSKSYRLAHPQFPDYMIGRVTIPEYFNLEPGQREKFVLRGPDMTLQQALPAAIFASLQMEIAQMSAKGTVWFRDSIVVMVGDLVGGLEVKAPPHLLRNKCNGASIDLIIVAGEGANNYYGYPVEKQAEINLALEKIRKEGVSKLSKRELLKQFLAGTVAFKRAETAK